MPERLVARLFCRLGWHDWDKATFGSDDGTSRVVRFCRECGRGSVPHRPPPQTPTSTPKEQ